MSAVAKLMCQSKQLLLSYYKFALDVILTKRLLIFKYKKVEIYDCLKAAVPLFLKTMSNQVSFAREGSWAKFEFFYI